MCQPPAEIAGVGLRASGGWIAPSGMICPFSNHAWPTGFGGCAFQPGGLDHRLERRRLAALERVQQQVLGRAARQRLQLGDHVGLEAPPAPARVRVDDVPAAQGQAGRRLADDEAVARRHRHRRLEAQLRPTAAPGANLLGIQQADPCRAPRPRR